MCRARFMILLGWLAVTLFTSSCRLGDGERDRPTEAPGEDQVEPAEKDFHRLEVIEYANGVSRHTTYFNGDGRKASDVAVVRSSRYGLLVEYHANGAIRSIGAIENGKRVGLWVEFDDTGVEKSERIYYEGQIVGRRE